MFVGMAVFQISEMIMLDQKYSLLDTLYFMSITVSTVGYGDITAKSQLAKVVVVCIIVGAIVYFPKLITTIMETYRTRRG